MSGSFANVIPLDQNRPGAVPRKDPYGASNEASPCFFSGVDVSFLGPEARRHAEGPIVDITLTQGIDVDVARRDNAPNNEGEFVLARVELDPHGTPVSVTLRRSISSSFEIFFAVLGTGRIIVSNRFDIVLCALQPDERSISEAAAIDHILARSVMGRDTHCDRIERVLHGEETRIDFRSGSITRRQFQLVPRVEEPGSVSDYLDRLDHALSSSLRAGDRTSSAALLFSGGVDSSLIATYEPNLSLLHCKIDSPEFDRETAYARRTSSLFGRPLREARVGEIDYLAAVEDAVDRIGAPPHHAMTALLGAGFALPYQRFVCGSDADTLLGFGNGVLLRSAMIASKAWAQPLLALGLRVVPGRNRARLRTVSAVAGMFRREVGDPAGFALGVKTPANLIAAQRIFGIDKVQARLRTRIDYLRTIGIQVPESSHDTIDHLAIRQILGYFTNNSFAVWRHLAASYGKSLACPFTDGRLLAAAGSIPDCDRYLSGFETKYLLKRLLIRRLPGYPRDLPKLGGVLPLRRFFEKGVLKAYSERYGLPDFAEGVELGDLGKDRHQFLWHAVTYSIWRHRSFGWTADSVPETLAATAARYVSPPAIRPV